MASADGLPRPQEKAARGPPRLVARRLATESDACLAIAGRYIDNPEGYCNLRHQDTTGHPPGHAPGRAGLGLTCTPKLTYVSNTNADQDYQYDPDEAPNEDFFRKWEAEHPLPRARA